MICLIFLWIFYSAECGGKVCKILETQTTPQSKVNPEQAFSGFFRTVIEIFLMQELNYWDRHQKVQEYAKKGLLDFLLSMFDEVFLCWAVNWIEIFGSLGWTWMFPLKEFHWGNSSECFIGSIIMFSSLKLKHLFNFYPLMWDLSCKIICKVQRHIWGDFVEGRFWFCIRFWQRDDWNIFSKVCFAV